MRATYNYATWLVAMWGWKGFVLVPTAAFALGVVGGMAR